MTTAFLAAPLTGGGFVTLQEAAKIKGVPARTVYGWVMRDCVRHKKDGYRVLIERESLENFESRGTGRLTCEETVPEEKQTEILRLADEGNTIKAIAGKVGLSRGCVRSIAARGNNAISKRVAERSLVKEIQKALKRLVPGVYVRKLADKFSRGLPDILILAKGQCLFVETKTVEGRESEIQASERRKIRRAGVHAIIARSVEDVTAALTEMKVI